MNKWTREYGMSAKDAQHYTGCPNGLPTPDKMPGRSWSISAWRCHTGGKWRKVAGSVCEICYAMRGHYHRPTVQDALQRRLRAFHENTPLWIEGMARLIAGLREPYFRWFDSGDLQSRKMFRAICEVCRLTPHINHYLPTKEHEIVRAERDKIPPNLVVRLSAKMLFAHLECQGGLRTTSVGSGFGFKCPSEKQDGKCGDCRACWDPYVDNIDYTKRIVR